MSDFRLGAPATWGRTSRVRSRGPVGLEFDLTRGACERRNRVKYPRVCRERLGRLPRSSGSNIGHRREFSGVRQRDSQVYRPSLSLTSRHRLQFGSKRHDVFAEHGGG